MPWRLQNALRKLNNVGAYYSRILGGRAKRNAALPQPHKVNVTCGYHGVSGGAIAMANTASLLAQSYDVDFLTHPASNLNPLLGFGVHPRRSISVDADIFIADVTFDTERLGAGRERGAKVIVCCHGLPDALHGLPPEHVRKSLENADKVVFVSGAQARMFQLPAERYVIIPNVTRRVEKSTLTNNIGVLGTLNEARKGVAKTVAVGLKSDARYIHLWGAASTDYGNSRVVVHGWEWNKKKIYDSFDVLVFLSESETFGMVVIEAMSAGIPCLLSNLDAFDDFRKCPGVVLVGQDGIQNAHRIVNDLLRNKGRYSYAMVTHWHENYSEEAVSRRWSHLINDLCVQTASRISGS